MYPLTLASIESTGGLTAPQNGRSQSRAKVEGRRKAGLATRQIPERYKEKLCVLSARFEEGYSDVTDVTGAFWEGEKGLIGKIEKCPDPASGSGGYLLAGVEEASTLVAGDFLAGRACTVANSVLSTWSPFSR